ncbi:MAG: UDP-N-acetylmuramate--L-alanine ligase [Acidimicrobiia bacterium]|nr:UDP-N-acetylmuramate--L-alanine ligase [Acidimicrobiia bacterium]
MRDPNSVPHRVHLVGAGGSGMSGLAKILSQLGHTVSGSDVKPGRMLDALADVGVTTWVGHHPERLEGVELVVASSAVPDRDAELAAARAAGIPVWIRPQLLLALTAANAAIGLAGTHGKTTSSALAVAALRGTGHDPSFLVGGQLVGMNTGAHVGADPTFVLEADEAFGTFRHLELASVLVTNIEADHLDHYGTLAALEDAFAQVVDRVDGPRVGCIDDPGVRRLAQRTPITTYGFSPDADWRITEIEHADGGVRFVLTGGGEPVAVTLPKPGTHLAANAAGVLATLALSGFDLARCAEALSGFAGVRRRYEIRAEVRGVTIVDDYAHHPTEVAATIEAAATTNSGRVIAVFQPHRYTRTADLGPEFGAPLALADDVIVTDVYSAGEDPIIGVSGRIVAQSVDAAGTPARYVPRLADVSQEIVGIASPGDVVLLLGAGDITSIAGEVAGAIDLR